VLELPGKERLVASVVHVALAAHTISSHQRWLIDRVGRSLGLSTVHITGIIAAAAAAVEPIAEDPVDRP
jgi:PIN domain nuclease of toxin-antitoxin system